MQIPERLRELIDDGLIEHVLRPLKSGKEASVFIVAAEGRFCAAKVYKAVENRTFRHQQDYVEGRRVGDSRQQRAMERGSRFGKQQREAAWQRTEADAMAKLHAAGARVPRVHALVDGVLLMDLVLDARGEPAPQLASTRLTRAQAVEYHRVVVRQVVIMLCAGLIHGDLSEYNILHAADGPMVIDLPQAVDVARNNNAKRLLLRDIASVTRFFARFAPELRRLDYGNEMWLLHENSALRPDSPLTGRFKEARKAVDTAIVMREIEAAKADAAKRAQIQRLRDEKRTQQRRG